MTDSLMGYTHRDMKKIFVIQILGHRTAQDE